MVFLAQIICTKWNNGALNRINARIRVFMSAPTQIGVRLFSGLLFVLSEAFYGETNICRLRRTDQYIQKQREERVKLAG